MSGVSSITEQDVESLLEALRKALPLSYACDVVGIPRRTIYDWMKKDKTFRTKIKVAKAEAIRGLVALTLKQGGAWKILKNIGKSEFKEIVEVEQTNIRRLVISLTGDDGASLQSASIPEQITEGVSEPED